MHAIEQAYERQIGDWILERDDGRGIWCRRASAPEVQGRLELRRLGVVSMSRADREVAVLRTCRHPGIPRVLDVGEDRQRRLAWRVVEARYDLTLADRLRDGPLPWEEACRRFLHLADALAYLHRAGLTHGRIEPAEIGLCRDGRTSFTGLGGVRALARGVALTDVYAFGRALYEALTGGTGLPARIYAGPDGPPPLPAIRLDPGSAFPTWLRQLVRAATEPDPSRRLPDAEALLGALEIQAASFAEAVADERTEPLPPPRIAAPVPRALPPTVPAPRSVDGWLSWRIGALTSALGLTSAMTLWMMIP